MKKILIYAHGGAYNHGAEALVQTTVRIIREKYKDAWIGLSTNFPEQDVEFAIPVDQYIAPNYEIWQKEKQAKDYDEKILLAKEMYAEALSYIDSDVTLISVGGDNYCYGNWHRLEVFQLQAKKCGAISILWGASIDAEHINQQMMEVLNTYTYILVRESLTYDALLKNGISTEVKLLPDVAFSLLSNKKIDIPEGKYVGINISPLVIRKETRKDVVVNNLIKLIDAVVENGYSVILIPHVTMSMDNDIEALTNVYNLLSERLKNKVILIDDNLAAAEYKDIVSKCDFVICSRTHISIAAYSQSVPTLVIGYSAKSVGIAKDLDMSEALIAIDRIEKEDTLKNLFCDVLYVKGEQYRAHLQKIMPKYISQIEGYKEYI